MSYNNIGLSTPRGSGTNGFVTRNTSHLKPRQDFDRNSRDDDAADYLNESLRRAPAKEILDHDAKRAVEVKCMDLRDKLEDEGLDEKEIETRVQGLRQKLLRPVDPPHRPTRR